MQVLFYALAMAGGLYAAIAATAYVFQERLVYFPTSIHVATPAAAGLDYRDVTLTTADDVRLHAWLVPRQGARYTVLFLHGNGGNVSHRVHTLRLLHDLGLATLIVDYRGYGHSGGKPSEQGTYRDAAAAWEWLTREHGLEAGGIIVFGRSLGGAVATWLAQRQSPAGLIVESSFTSLPDMASHHYPWLPARWLSRMRYNSVSRIAAAGCPVLVVHSPGDTIVPVELGRRLFEAAAPPRTFLEISGDHNEGYLVSGERYARGLRAFIDTLGEDGA